MVGIRDDLLAYYARIAHIFADRDHENYSGIMLAFIHAHKQSIKEREPERKIDIATSAQSKFYVNFQCSSNTAVKVRRRPGWFTKNTHHTSRHNNRWNGTASKMCATELISAMYTH